MLQDAERRVRVVLSCEEMGQSGYLGSYQDSIVSVTQNCVLVSNILGQSCVFLSKGMAKCRQAVRKSGQKFLPVREAVISAIIKEAATLLYIIFSYKCGEEGQKD